MNDSQKARSISSSVRSAKAGRTPGGRVSLGRASLLAFLIGVANGCYVYTPVQSFPVGETVSFRLNDRGRVALGQNLGPSVDRVEGVIASMNDSAYVLNVRSVTYFNGQANIWSGERVVLGKAFVSEQEARRFSKARTALAIGGGVAGVVAFIVTRALLGKGDPDVDNGGSGPGTGQLTAPSW